MDKHLAHGDGGEFVDDGFRQGEVEIRWWCSSPAEYAVLSPEREDYLRTQIAHRSGFRVTPVCTCEIDSREAATTRRLTFDMNMTLHGYIAAPGGDIGWSGTPSEELFQWWLYQERASGLSLYGRAEYGEKLMPESSTSRNRRCSTI